MRKNIVIYAAVALICFISGFFGGKSQFFRQSLKYQAFFCKAAADRGHDGARLAAGIMCAQELGTPLNEAASFKYWQEAAGHDMPEAAYLLGLAYEQGLGSFRNYIDAAKLYEQAAAQGHIKAQARLGIMYCEGRGADTDWAKGAALLEKASSAGDERAKIYLEDNKNQIDAAGTAESIQAQESGEQANSASH